MAGPLRAACLTNIRSWSLASTPSPAPRFPTPDAVPGPAADAPGRHPTPEDELTRKFSTSSRDSASEDKGADPEVREHITLPPLAPVPDQQTSPTLPVFPGQPFLFDLEIPHLTASPEQLESTQKRSRDDFEADLGAVLDTELFGDQSLGIWFPEETEGVLHQGLPLEGDLQVSVGVPTAPETDRPEGTDGEEEEKRDAKRSPRAGRCKRRKV